MTISDSKKKEFCALINDERWGQEILEKIEARKVNPYPQSALPYWLKLETWTEKEGIYILAGIDPNSVVDQYSGLGGITQFSDATPFEKSDSFFLDPIETCSESEFAGGTDAYQSYLEAYERKKEILDRKRNLVSTLSHVLSRSVAGLGQAAIKSESEDTYKPEQFTRWASSIFFEPDWFKWARDNKYLNDNSSESPPVTDKPLSTTERNTLLTVIAALCDYSALDTQARGTAKQISSMTSELGAEVSDDTVRAILKKIPGALEARMK